MLTRTRLDRINELAKKAKTEQLTEEEIIERAELREAYLANFRKTFKGQLDAIEIVDPDEK